MHPTDTEAKCLPDLAAGEAIGVQVTSKALQIRVLEPIALCHKIALEALDRGQSARKYGEVIGSIYQPIAAGGHVHVHNLKSGRAQVKPQEA